MKMNRWLSVLLVLVLTFSFAVPTFAAESATVVSYSDVTKDEAKLLIASDAIKIPSNAHQDTVPGINFRWADKQNNDCVLTVDALVVDTGFTVLVKDSNEYKSVQISGPGVYLFPKYEADGKIHNINMVWLCNFITFEDFYIPVISSADTRITTSRFMVGNYGDNVPFVTDAVVTDTGTHYGVNAWMNALKSVPNYDGLMALAPQFIWNAGSNGIESSIAKSGEAVKFEQSFQVEGSRITANTNLRIAADNGFLVFINGTFIGQSITILHSYSLTSLDEKEIADIFGDLTRTNGFVEHGNWAKIYDFNITSALRTGTNTLTIYAYNTAHDTTCSIIYNNLTNPAGIIYSFDVSSTNRP